MVIVQMIVVFATALLFSLAVIPLVTRLATVSGWLDKPDGGGALVGAVSGSQTTGRRIHLAPIPRLGGIGITLGFVLSLILWTSGGRMGWVVGPSLVIFAMGLVDDLRHLPARIKLAIQVGASAVAIVMSDLTVQTLVFTEHIHFALPLWLGLPLSLFIVVGAINAINMIDGLDGLAGGVVLIGVVLLSYLHILTTGDYAILLFMTLPLTGALVGFLRYNSHPATIFMGDSGSNWLGYMTGIIMLMVLSGHTVSAEGALLTGRDPSAATAVPLVTALMCLAVPIFDTACVIIDRTRQGLHPMHPDQRHFHHTLLRLGLNHAQSVTAVYFVALAAGVLGLAPVAFPAYSLWWMPYAAAAGLATLIPLGLQVAGSSNRMLISSLLAVRSRSLDHRVRRFLRLWENLNRYTIYGILFLAPVVAGAPKREIGLAAGCLAAAQVVVGFLGRARHDILQNLVLALAVTVLLVANNAGALQIEMLGNPYNVQSWYNYAFVWLAISTVAFMATTIRRNYLIIRPSDFLLVVFPLILILIPEPFRSEYRLNVIGMRALVVFAALRTMVRRRQHALTRINMIIFLGLAYVFLAGALGLRLRE